MVKIDQTKLLKIVKERLKVSKDILNDQFLIAAARINSHVRDIIDLIRLNEINPKMWVFGFNDIKSITKLGKFDEIFKNPKTHASFLVNRDSDNFDFQRIEKYLKHFGIQFDRLNVEKYSESFANEIVKSVLKQFDRKEQNLIYFEPSQKYESSECPVCMCSFMKYVWLPCGHNLCKDCFDKIVGSSERSESIKCPYCGHSNNLSNVRIIKS